MLHIMSPFLYDAFPLGDISSLEHPIIHHVEASVMPYHIVLRFSCVIRVVDLEHIGIQLTFEPLFPLLVPHTTPFPENSVHLWGLLGYVNLHFTLYQVEGSRKLNENVIL